MFARQISLRSILFGILLVAADCAALRFALGDRTYGLVFGIFGILPMANILAIACYRSLSRRMAARPSFVGFVSSGAIAILLWFNWCLSAEERRLGAFGTWMNQTLRSIPFVYDISNYIDNQFARALYLGFVHLFFLASMTALPQLFLAVLGGWVARRLAPVLNPTRTTNHATS
jgi:hypothetical protein